MKKSESDSDNMTEIVFKIMGTYDVYLIYDMYLILSEDATYVIVALGDDDVNINILILNIYDFPLHPSAIEK